MAYILLQLCKSLFKAFLELYCRFPGLVRTVKLFIHRHSNSYCECVAWIQCTKPERACKLNLSNQHWPRAALCHSLTFLSSVPRLCIFRPKFTHHYTGSLQSDRVCCSLENSLPVNLLVLSASPESWRAEFILPSVAPSVDNLLCWEDLDRRNIR